MKVCKRFFEFLNGKQYCELTKDERNELRNSEYNKVTGLYIITVNSILIFSIFVLSMISLKLIKLPLNTFAYTVTFIGLSFLALMSVLLILQKYKKPPILHKIKFDIGINAIILIFFTIMTLYNIKEVGYVALYAVGLIMFAFLVRVRPTITLVYFFFTMLGVLIYVNTIGFQSYRISYIVFVANIMLLNFITFSISRLHFIDNVRNFSQQKIITQQNIELEMLSIKDYMTNVYNRRGFAQRIKEEIKTPAAICLIDLDGLKLINDALGHEKGDFAIILTTKIIKKVFKDCFYARTGGDEFVIIIEETNEKEVAQKVEQFRELLEYDQSLEINISASLGYAMISSQRGFMKAYKKAENIMYHIKLGARSSRKNRSMEALMSALHEYTGETKRHCHHVGFICQKLVAKLGYERAQERDAMKLIGQLHDIGKLSIPQKILQKKGKLTQEEWRVMKQHSEESYKIVCGLIEDKEISNAILYHHEHWDGTGYPYQLKSDEIPLYARVISVADAYDAMRTKRVYQKKKTHEEACEELKRCAGSQFDPHIVEEFLSMTKEEIKY